MLGLCGIASTALGPCGIASTALGLCGIAAPLLHYEPMALTQLISQLDTQSKSIPILKEEPPSPSGTLRSPVRLWSRQQGTADRSERAVRDSHALAGDRHKATARRTPGVNPTDGHDIHYLEVSFCLLLLWSKCCMCSLTDFFLFFFFFFFHSPE